MEITMKNLNRTTFRTSRELEYFSEKELSMSLGYSKCEWPRAILKELIDNALDSCESIGVDPEIQI
jgi:DNA topoisomerase VI subunit B